MQGPPQPCLFLHGDLGHDVGIGADLAIGAIAAVLVVAGAAVALHAWRREKGLRDAHAAPPPAPARDDLSLWDVAGAYVFFGCVAAGLADPDAIARLF